MANPLAESTGLLAGVVVVDAGEGVACGFGSWLLADLGARVVKVEGPAGDRLRLLGPFPEDRTDVERGGLHLALNAGKESVALDLKRDSERERLFELLSNADVFVDSAPAGEMATLGIDYASLARRFPWLVHGSHSPFGEDGPYAGRVTSEIVDWAMGGYMYFCGEPGRPPLMLHGQQAELHAGMQLATGILGALWHARRTGRGQHVDVSTFESMMTAHVWFLSSWLQEGLLWRRKGSALIPCANGHFAVGAPSPDLFLLMDRAELMLEERYLTDAGWRDVLPEVMAMLEEWAADKSMEEVYHRGQAARVKIAPVNTVADLSTSAQLAARGWWRTFEHPRGGSLDLPRPPWRLSRSVAPELRAAPLIGSGLVSPLPKRSGSRLMPVGEKSDAEALPLAGFRVLEVTTAWAGPLAGRHLADLGADVILVERHSAHGTRGHHFPGGPEEVWPRFYNRGGGFNLLNRNKRGTAINLRSAPGRELFLRLSDRADVVIENNSPHVLPALGLGYEELAERNPGLVMCSLSGFGAKGPEAQYRALGSSIEASCGLVAQTGYAPGQLYTTGSFHADPIGGTLAALAILAALWERESTGRGQQIDLSLQESGALFVIESIVDYRLNGRIAGPRGNRSSRIAPQGAYPSAGGDCWVAIGIEDDEQWQALCRAIDRPELAARFPDVEARRASHDIIDEAVAAWSRGLDHQEATRLLQAVGVPAGPVLANWEAASDPHLYRRGFWLEDVHPEVGYERWEGAPWRLSATPVRMRQPAPLLGQHNDDVLREVLGLDAEELEELRANGTVANEPDNPEMFSTPSRAGP